MAQLTIQQAFELGLQHHQAGRLREAEQLYRQVLVQQPKHFDALHLLGVIAHQVGRNDIAVDLIRRAISIIPNSPEAYSNLGIALKDKGQLDEAITAYQEAITLSPNVPEVHYNLGLALKDKGQLDEAVIAYRQAIALNPDYAEAHSDLGSALKDEGDIDEAIAAYRRAIRLNPNLPEAHNNLGIALKDKGQLDEAIAAYRQSIALNPCFAVAQSNLGVALKEKGQLEEAVAACRQAIILNPSNPEAHSNLGICFASRGQLDEAIAAFRHAIILNPNFPDAHYNLGVALKDKRQPDQAIAAYRRAIVLKPRYAEAHSNLGSSLKDMGQINEAVAAFRQAVHFNPNFPAIHSSLVFALYYHPSSDTQTITEEHRRWNRQHADAVGKFIQPHPNDRDPDRRLRIGYASSDFRDHVVGQNLLPLFHHHDRRSFEITCYAQVLRPDAITSRLQKNADRWRDIVGLSDEQIAKQICEDRIDVLVDLALHTKDNRLLVFARKPAPVQATFMGYPGSTGLTAIDYRLSDPYLDPPGMDESVYSEQTIRLPDTFWCYDPLVSEVAVNSLPAISNGHITFGCLNNFCKVNEQVLQLWIQVLKAVDRSRLMILCPEGSHRQPLLNRLQREGIDLDRIELVANRPRLEYLELYHRIDVGLDTFPYNGHTTSLDSLWMGVPVVTLVGKTVVGRAGLSQLSNLGLTELITHTPEKYVEIAAGLAKDLSRLIDLRRTLRSRMEQSPLMDAPRFVRNIEAAYRLMWRNWVQG